MKIGILSRNERSWCSQRLEQAFKRRSVESVFLKFTDLVAEVGVNEEFYTGRLNVKKNLSAILIRPIGRGSLEEIIFRIDLLHGISSQGLPVVNSPVAIERAADKYRTLSLLAKNNVPIPKSIITQNISEALEGFDKLGGEIVLKPIFGSRGIGSTRISDRDLAERACRTLLFQKQVIYMQEFLNHVYKDIRAFVIDERVISAMERKSSNWKKNISRGGNPSRIKLSTEVEEMAVKAAETINCKIAGVDVIETSKGAMVLEVNSQPGWRGLQSVSKVDVAGEIADFLIRLMRK